MLGCEGDQLITGKCSECLERPEWIFHQRRVWVSVVVLPWFYCDELSRPCQFYWTPFLLSVKTCLPQVYYWVTQVNWRAHQASLVSQKLSRRLSWRIINSLIWEFVTNSSWSVSGMWGVTTRSFILIQTELQHGEDDCAAPIPANK